MVPFFRKSFLKHYISAWVRDQDEFADTDFLSLYDQTYTDQVGVVRSTYDQWIDGMKGHFFEKTGLTKDDFTLANKAKLDKRYYNSALCDTLNEPASGR